jgi:serine O-acetyltransferase
MLLSMPAAALSAYVAGQMNAVFPDRKVQPAELVPHLGRALERYEHCVSRINLKYFTEAGQARFDHLHTDQYAMFLYFLANSIYRMEGDLSLASKSYALNKALHSLDAFYEVELPEVFGLQHPVGTVLGRGSYSDYFFAYQRCSVGANLRGEYPSLGQGVVLFGGSAVIGNCRLAGNCWLSVGAVLMDQDVPANSIVFGRSPQVVLKPTSRDVVRDFFARR